MTNTIALRVERMGRVWTPEAKLYFPQQNGQVTFASPAAGSTATGAVLLGY